MAMIGLLEKVGSNYVDKRLYVGDQVVNQSLVNTLITSNPSKHYEVYYEGQVGWDVYLTVIPIS